MLLAGLGIGQLYETTARMYLSSGTLVQVPKKWNTPSAPVTIILPWQNR
jgi:DNA-binding transcriptional LysR family regulator